MRQIAVAFLVVGVLAVGALLWDQLFPTRPSEIIVAADTSNGGLLPDGTMSTENSPGFYGQTTSLTAGILESIGAVSIGPLSEFFGIEPTAGAARWAGAVSPLVLSLLFWIAPSPFRRKAKP